MTKLLTRQSYPIRLRDRLNAFLDGARRIIGVSIFLFINIVPSSFLRWHFKRKSQRGEPIVLDRLAQGVVSDVPATQRGNITPKTYVTSRKSKVMKLDAYPTTDYVFTYETAPRSGNLINGLGETVPRQATEVFHTGKYTDEWGGLQRYFDIIDILPIETLRAAFHMSWIDSQNMDLPAPVRQTIEDPREMADRVKETGRSLGAVLIGITELKPEHIYEGRHVPYRYAVSCAVTMDREGMLHTPSADSTTAIFEGYRDAAYVSVELARRIRALGWEARATSNMQEPMEILHLPIAVAAGVGQMGKHGSLITKEYGSNVRLGTVLTNLPLAIDAPVDIGVDDFCTSCQICTTNCPPQAIFDTKQMVRGEKKWYVDFDTCVPYFVSYHGCGICIEVCPWSEEGRGASISQKMLEKRSQKLE